MQEISGSGCTAKAPFALQVLGDSMEPEFMDGCIIIVDPDHPYGDGAFVIADYQGETTFRQFVIREARHFLVALNQDYEDIELTDTYKIRGVVTQQARNRRKGIKRAKHYV